MEKKLNQLEIKFREIMEILGMDLEDDSLIGTPARLAKLYGKEVFSGMDEKNAPRIMVVENKFAYDQMVTVKATVNSMCEHHFLPFMGTARISYIPNKKVIGLSKINRIVKYFSRRPQVQERLTAQIAKYLIEVLGTENVAVSITAIHTCVKVRGIEDAEAETTSTELHGIYKEDGKARQEFLK